MNTNLKNTLIAFLLLAVLVGQFFAAPQTARAAFCDAALFVADVTVPDGSIFPPSTAFTKTWRLKNVGTCTWTNSYKLVFSGGTELSAPEATFLPTTVAPGATVDLSLNMLSPAGNSTYRGYWQLMNATGARFGVGPAADKFFWVEIVVRGGVLPLTPTPMSFLDNFALGGVNANWQNGQGKLDFPGEDGSARGFALTLDSVQLETGAFVNQPTLLMGPQAKTDGYIQGFFPAIPIQSGDRFQTTIGCQYGATACYVTYRIDYRTSAGTKTLWTFKEKYEGLTYNVNLDLSFLAGKNVEFFLLVLASGSPSGDRALWVAPHIAHLGSPPPTTIPPTLTPFVTVTTSPLTATPTGPTATPTGPTATPTTMPGTATPITPPATSVPAGNGYPFAPNGGAASWLSGAGKLTFPGTDGDSRGFALKLDSIQMETGGFVNEPSLLMVPQNKTDGYIQGLFPALTIQSGDRFQTTIGCQYGATSCYVTYRIDYRTSTGTKTLWTFKEKYEGLTYNVNLDLSFLAGKNVEFFLLVLASGSPSGDRAVWIAPRIARTGGLAPSATATLTPAVTVATSTPTAMPATAYPTGTMTPTPATHANWVTYTNTAYGFQFQYPPEGQISNDQGGLVYISLPIVPGTNLTSKYLQAAAAENTSVCTSLPVGGSGNGQPVTFNGIAFKKETGQDRGAGQIRDWTNYFTVKGTTCISVGFVLHSGNIGAFPTPIVEFDFAAESAVFEEIMSTFTWLSAP